MLGNIIYTLNKQKSCLNPSLDGLFVFFTRGFGKESAESVQNVLIRLFLRLLINIYSNYNNGADCS